MRWSRVIFRGKISGVLYRSRHCPLSPRPLVVFSGRCQAADGVREDISQGMRGTEVKANEGELLFEDGSNLDEFQSDRLAGGLRKFGAAESEAADGLDQGVGQAGEEQPPLIGPP